MNYNKICNEALKLDDAIRFAGIASLDGKILAAVFREGLTPLLTKEEAELSIFQSLIRMSLRKTLQPQQGRALYSSTVYEKIRRATILLSTGEKDSEITYLMVAFEKDSDHDEIITAKILPFLKDVE